MPDAVSTAGSRVPTMMLHVDEVLPGKARDIDDVRAVELMQVHGLAYGPADVEQIRRDLADEFVASE